MFARSLSPSRTVMLTEVIAAPSGVALGRLSRLTGRSKSESTHTWTPPTCAISRGRAGSSDATLLLLIQRVTALAAEAALGGRR